jgi:hypothetical protein
VPARAPPALPAGLAPAHVEVPHLSRRHRPAPRQRCTRRYRAGGAPGCHRAWYSCQCHYTWRASGCGALIRGARGPAAAAAGAVQPPYCSLFLISLTNPALLRANARNNLFTWRGMAAGVGEANVEVAVRDSYPLPIEVAWDLLEVTYLRPPWLSESCHPRWPCAGAAGSSRRTCAGCGRQSRAATTARPCLASRCSPHLH